MGLYIRRPRRGGIATKLGVAGILLVAACSSPGAEGFDVVTPATDSVSTSTTTPSVTNGPSDAPESNGPDSTAANPTAAFCRESALLSVPPVESGDCGIILPLDNRRGSSHRTSVRQLRGSSVV